MPSTLRRSFEDGASIPASHYKTTILGMIYDATSKDPRKELRMLSSFSSFNGQSLDEFILTLHKSPHTGSFNSRHVKMNKFVIISKKGDVVLEISADMSTKLIRNIERKK